MINKIVHSVAAKLQPKTQLQAQNNHRAPCLTEQQEAIITSGSKFTIITIESGLIKESLYLNRDDWWKTEIDKTEKFKRISQPIFVAGNPGYQNYYHWTYQIWSSILFAKANSETAARIDVLGPTLNSWRRRYIELLGPKINYIEAEPDCAYFLDHAYWSDLMWQAYAFNPSHRALEALEEFGGNFRQETPSRIYISRKDTPRRGVANEDAVEKILVDRGFTPVLLSTLPLTEQIGFLRGAEFIVAPHGAGLTNIVFCSRNKKLIELLPDDYFNQCFRAIAVAKGFDYIGIINPSTTDPRGYHFSKINADIQLLSLAIDEMEKQQ
jgi:capsular polysaccharide biosynthesis protein